MSRSGKFIPGARKSKEKEATGELSQTGKAEPIRANQLGEDPNEPLSKRLFGKSKIRFSQQKSQQRRPGILLISVIFCFSFILAMGYFLYIIPAQQEAARAIAELQQQRQEMEELKRKQEELARAQAESAVQHTSVTVTTNPSGAQLQIGNQIFTSPATLKDIPSGDSLLKVSLEGYASVELPLKLEPGQSLELPVIDLQRQTGTLKLASSSTQVTFHLTGPDNYSQKGSLPLHLPNLIAGNYQIVLTHKGWELPPQPIQIQANQTTQEEAKFAYGSLHLETSPEGAQMTNERHKLGETPFTLQELRPGTWNIGLDKFGYQFQRIRVEIKPFEETRLSIKLKPNNDLKTSFGMEMIRIAQGFYAGKYEVTQEQFLKVMGHNPSISRGSNYPVDNVTWKEAMEFCKKATVLEHRKGTIPSNSRFTLPSESQWTLLMADAQIETSITSYNISRQGPEEVGASEPNEYGLYDIIGNVGEWTNSLWRSREGYRTIRGGNWLSSRPNFPDRSKANGAKEMLRDKFTGFRVVLVR